MNFSFRGSSSRSGSGANGQRVGPNLMPSSGPNPSSDTGATLSLLRSLKLSSIRPQTVISGQTMILAVDVDVDVSLLWRMAEWGGAEQSRQEQSR